MNLQESGRIEGKYSERSIGMSTMGVASDGLCQYIEADGMVVLRILD
jgi:hypothetical protein